MSPSEEEAAPWLGRYDRGELEQNLESAWGADWRESIYLKEKATEP